MPTIAIDGPSGAGKTTIANHAAQTLGFLHVDTGAIYRAVGLAALRRGLDCGDAAQIETLLPDLTVELIYQNGEQQMLLNGENVTAQLRTPAVSMAASDCSKLPCVRAFLLRLQRGIAETGSVIMDGRDIGTVVLPHADLKIFLTADTSDRARRRYEELLRRGQTVTYDEVLADVTRRDTQDEQRAAAPLKPAADAVIVDTTGNTLEKSMDIITKLIREKLNV